MELLLCPLKKELEFFLEGLRAEGLKPEERESKLGPLYKLSATLTAGVGGFGQSKLEEKTKRFLGEFKEIKRIICLGTAGALSPQLKIYDIVSPSEWLFIEGSQIKERRAVKIEHGKLQVMGAKFHCSEIPVMNLNERQRLLTAGAEAVVMESLGISEMLPKHSIEYEEYRIITDLADDLAEEDFVRHLQSGMKKLAVFLGPSLLAQRS